MDAVGQPRKQLGTEAYYYAMIDTPNGMSSDLEYIANSLMVGRKTQSNNKNIVVSLACLWVVP